MAAPNLTSSVTGGARSAAPGDAYLQISFAWLPVAPGHAPAHGGRTRAVMPTPLGRMGKIGIASGGARASRTLAPRMRDGSPLVSPTLRSVAVWGNSRCLEKPVKARGLRKVFVGESQHGNAKQR